MKERIWGILSEESLLGRITSRLWILFGANVLFVLFSLPIVTAGPAWVAMYYVCLKTLRVDSTLNPIREFWNGFRMNFKQAFLGFLGFLVIAAILILDIMFVARTQGSMRLFRYPVYVVSGIMLLILFFTALFWVRSDIDRLQAEDTTLQLKVNMLEMDFADLQLELARVGSEGYVENAAREEYGFIKQGEIVFAFENPDALKGYTEEEYQIIMDEMRD